MTGIDIAKLKESRTTSSGGVELVVAATSPCGIVDVQSVSCTTNVLRWSGLVESLLRLSFRVPHGARPIRELQLAGVSTRPGLLPNPTFFWSQ